MAAMRTLRGGARSERGAELIELMVVTPLLLLMLAALFDFGMLFRSWEVVTNAAREGGRIASLPDYMSDPANARNRVEQYMKASGLMTAAQSCSAGTLTSGTCGPSGACSVCVVDSTVTLSGSTVSTKTVVVRSDQTLPSIGAFAPLFGGGSIGTIPVQSTSSMRTESAAVSGS